MQTITIEIRTDFALEGRKEKEEAMVIAARMAAKHLYATAILQSDKRKPEIKMFAGDLVEGDEEINLAEDF